MQKSEKNSVLYNSALQKPQDQILHFNAHKAREVVQRQIAEPFEIIIFRNLNLSSLGSQRSKRPLESKSKALDVVLIEHDEENECS